MKLKPDECVIRFCRSCGKQMHLSSYDWDIHYRWYHFHCNDCGYDVSLGENIMPRFRSMKQSDGDYLEPLTKEEMESQSLTEANVNREKMAKDIGDEIKKEEEKKDGLEKHKLSDDDLEDST